MSFLHAAYSGGAVLGALETEVLLWAGLGYRLVYLLLLVPLAASIVAFAAARLQLSAGVYGEAPSDGHRVLGRLLRYNDARGHLLSTVRRYLAVSSSGPMGKYTGVSYLQERGRDLHWPRPPSLVVSPLAARRAGCRCLRCP